MGDTTETLAGFVAQLTYDDIPERVRERCKELLLDSLACALAGHLGEETHQVSAFASALGQSRESSIIGGGKLSLAGATLLNGYLITAVTMCDVHRPTTTHVTPEVVPSALVMGEREAASGRDLLVALAAGLEATTRVGLGLDYPAFRSRGWHGPGVIGPFGSAATAGRLLGLSPDLMAVAFGLAGSQAAGTFAAWGTPTVKFHQCRGSLSGVMAALLAQQGFVATHHFLTAPDGGLYNSYTNGGKPEAVTAGLGDRWELEQIALRLWPSASTIQGLITAMFDLVEQHDLKPEDVRRIRVALGKTAFDMHGIFPRYNGKFEALLSSHYAATVVLHDRTLTLSQFEPSRYNDPRLKHFAAEQVEVRLDPQLTGVQSIVEVETVAGQKLSVRCDVPKGSPEKALSWAEIEGKFRAYAPARISSEAVEKVLDSVAHLERLESVGTLTSSLSSAS